LGSNSNKHIVVVTAEVWADTMADAVKVVNDRIQTVDPRSDKHMVLVQDVKASRAKDQR
jgi:hypothetical protein